MKNIPIIYENEEILIINKPAGIAVQGGEGIKHPMDEELPKQLGYKIHLVHRLDKETCGLMVVAKSPKAAAKWIKLISGKLVQKEYTAICFGSPKINGKPQKKGTIQATVKKAERELPAVTNFTVESEWKSIVEKKLIQEGENSEPKTEKVEIEFSKVNLKLGTGRMHQIRIHLASVGAPIAGDDKHGDFKKNKLVRKLGIKNLLLCSQKLTIPTNDGKSKTFEIELPEYFEVKK